MAVSSRNCFGFRLGLTSMKVKLKGNMIRIENGSMYENMTCATI